MFQDFFLDIDGIYSSTASNDMRSSDRVVSGTGTELADFHSLFQSHLEDVAFGFRELHCIQNSTRRLEKGQLITQPLKQ